MSKLFLITSGEYSDYRWQAAVLGDRAAIVKSLTALRTAEQSYNKTTDQLDDDWRKEKFGSTSTEIHITQRFKLTNNYAEIRYSRLYDPKYDHCPITIKHRELYETHRLKYDLTDGFDIEKWLIDHNLEVVHLEEIHNDEIIDGSGQDL